MASIVDNTTRPGCSEREGARPSAGTGVGIRGDADGPKETESKVIDITTLDKANKTPILVCY